MIIIIILFYACSSCHTSWLKPCVSESCGAKFIHFEGVDTYIGSATPPGPIPTPPYVPPTPDAPVPLQEDWHFPKEEVSILLCCCYLLLNDVSHMRMTNNVAKRIKQATEMAAVMQALPRVTLLSVTSNTSVRVALASAGSSHTFTTIGEVSGVLQFTQLLLGLMLGGVEYSV